MTIPIIIGSLLLGVILGRSFKVFVLIPVSALILVALAARAYYFGLGFLTLAADSAVLLTSLQIGYVAIPFLTAIMVALRHIGTYGKHTDSVVSEAFAARRQRPS